MKVWAVAAEGTPEELAQLPGLDDLLRSMRQQENGSLKSRPLATGIPDELAEFIARRGGNSSQRRWVEDFATRALGHGNIEWDIGKSKQFADGQPDYFKLYKAGPRIIGALAYVKPRNGLVTFRVGVKAAKGLKHAIVREVVAEDPYQVNLPLRDTESVDEALVLLHKALTLAKEQ